MQCEDARNFLQDLAEGHLSEAARNTIERHIGECAVCGADLKALGYVDEQLKKQPVVPEPPGLVDRVMARIFPTQVVSFRKELLRFAAAAMVLIAVTLGILSIDINKVVDPRASLIVEKGLKSPIDQAVNRVNGVIRSLSEEK